MMGTPCWRSSAVRVLSAVIVTMAFHGPQAGLAAAQRFVHSSARDVPVSAKVDILVVGGNEGGLAAAWTAAKAGSSVLVVGGHYFFSDDVSAKARYWLEPDEVPRGKFSQALFGDRAGGTAILPNARPVQTQPRKPAARCGRGFSLQQQTGGSARRWFGKRGRGGDREQGGTPGRDGQGRDRHHADRSRGPHGRRSHHAVVGPGGSGQSRVLQRKSPRRPPDRRLLRVLAGRSDVRTEVGRNGAGPKCCCGRSSTAWTPSALTPNACTWSSRCASGPRCTRTRNAGRERTNSIWTVVFPPECRTSTCSVKRPACRGRLPRN